MLLFLLLVFPVAHCQLNNACNNYFSYFNIFFSSDCYHTPDNHLEVPGIVRHHLGVAAETHRVTTVDGYILTLFRIPRQSAKGVVLFQHGLAQDSRAWLSQSNQSIALVFWRRGYDVWLGNSRGTHYSKGHVEFHPLEEDFWDFSYHEMGYYDLNATIGYIKEVTNVGKVFYVGHSMGAVAGVIFASLRPEEAKEGVKLMVLLAPVCYSQDAPTPLRPFSGFISFLMKRNYHRRLRVYSFPEYNSLLFKMARLFNRLFPFKYFLSALFSSIGGWNPDEFDPNFVNLAVDLSGSGSAIKIYAHGYQQSLPNVTFQMFDHGKKENFRVYGAERPPPYPLENIKVPVFTIYGQNDSLSFGKNIEALHERLRPEANFGKKEVRNFNHIDFLWGRRRHEAVYEDVLRVFDEFGDKETRSVCRAKKFCDEYE